MCLKPCRKKKFPILLMRYTTEEKTVKEYLKKQTSVKKVIFNVFKDLDKEMCIRDRYTGR